LVRFIRDGVDRVALVPDALAAGFTDGVELQLSRARLFGNWQRNDDDAVAVGDVRDAAVDRARQGDLALVSSDAPFVAQNLVLAFEATANGALQDYPIVGGDLDADVLRFKARHRRRDHQTIAATVQLDRK
jgi:hypothetical protein